MTPSHTSQKMTLFPTNFQKAAGMETPNRVRQFKLDLLFGIEVSDMFNIENLWF